jgi:hypothetical protein
MAPGGKLAFSVSAVYVTTEAVSRPHRSDRSLENSLNPATSDQRVTET